MFQEIEIDEMVLKLVEFFNVFFSDLNELILYIREIMVKGIKLSKGRICYIEYFIQVKILFGFVFEVLVVIVFDLCIGGNFVE